MIGHLLLSAAMKKVVSDLEAFSLRFENLLADGGSALPSRAPGAPTEDIEESARRSDGVLRTAGSLEVPHRRPAPRGQIEQEEIESGELNLIPYLDIVTNLMLFLLASVSAGLILAQIDTTLPDKAPPSPTTVRSRAPTPTISRSSWSSRSSATR